MPQLNFSEVISFSSEDKNHSVKSLLNPDSYKKWLSSDEIQKDTKQFVILKLEKLSKINSIHIGNEHSAFIEVLVARESTNYQVLLATSSFMTPLESRNSNSPNRVRMFESDKLNKEVLDKEWDRIKIICSQPFNKNIRFGLSFLKVFAPDDGLNEANEVSSALGRFKLKDDSSSDIKIGSFFQKRKEASPSTSGPAAIREASRKLAAKRNSEEIDDIEKLHNSKKSKVQDGNKSPKSLQNKRDVSNTFESNSSPIANTVSLSTKSSAKKPEKTTSVKVDKNSEKSSDSKNSRTQKFRNSGILQKSEKLNKTKPNKPFNKLMEDVIFCMSGYQNPQRANLRDKLVSMGAKYRPDWGRDCTHLICAFKNTPKYQTVVGRGKIVTHKWIEDCHSKKIKYPWRRYDIDKSQEPESDDEIWATEICPQSTTTRDSGRSQDNSESEGFESMDTDEEIQKVLSKNVKSLGLLQNKNEKDNHTRSSLRKSNNRLFESEKPEKSSVKSPKSSEKSTKTPTKATASEDSTQSPQTGKKSPEKSPKREKLSANSVCTSSDEAYDADTDIDSDQDVQIKPKTLKFSEDSPPKSNRGSTSTSPKSPASKSMKTDTSHLSLPALPDFFEGMKFFMYEVESNADELERYITAYGGEIVAYMNSEVDVVLSEKSWERSFDEALAENSRLKIVKPEYVWECCKKREKIPFKRFLIHRNK